MEGVEHDSTPSARYAAYCSWVAAVVADEHAAPHAPGARRRPAGCRGCRPAGRRPCTSTCRSGRRCGRARRPGRRSSSASSRAQAVGGPEEDEDAGRPRGLLHAPRLLPQPVPVVPGEGREVEAPVAGEGGLGELDEVGPARRGVGEQPADVLPVRGHVGRDRELAGRHAEHGPSLSAAPGGPARGRAPSGSRSRGKMRRSTGSGSARPSTLRPSKSTVPPDREVGPVPRVLGLEATRRLHGICPGMIPMVRPDRTRSWVPDEAGPAPSRAAAASGA